jgi:methyltransferase (TIGR00027 family)
MKAKQSGRTAEGMAIVRAIEASKPEARRICYDPIARSLVSRVSFILGKLVIDSGIYDHLAPGVVAFITARERYIDDFLKACLTERLDQVIILGAGFDTRAYRIPGIKQTHVFEIDHPTIQKDKLKRLQKVMHPLPNHVTFLPMDFKSQTLDECLLNSGYNEQNKTLFIWQGVTVYLTPEGVDSTLAFMVHHSRPGSAVIFDYFHNETLRDTSRPGVGQVQLAAPVTGEEYLFGIDKGQIEPFLNQRGFHQVRNVTATDLKRFYFTGPNVGRVLLTGCDIVSARVSKATN